MVLQVGRVFSTLSRSFFSPQETLPHFWIIFGPVLGTSIFTTNRFNHMYYAMVRANGTICGDFRIARYRPGGLSLPGGRPASGLPLSLPIRASLFLFTRNAWCLQILYVSTRLGSVFRPLCSIFTDSLSIISAFSPCFQGLFQPIPGWYVHLICAPSIPH